MAKDGSRRHFARLWSGLAVVALLFFAVVAAGVAVPRGGTTADTQVGQSRQILLLAGPVHSDIALPADPLTRERFAFLSAANLPLEHPDLRWIIVGWGGRSFYTQTPTWAELKPMPVVKTLVGDRSAMHVALAGPIDRTQPGVEAISVSEAAYRRLLDAVLDDFARDKKGAPVLIRGVAYGPDDRFFEARGTFHILRNCNTWTARMLRAAGITTGLWTPLPQLLSLSLEFHERR